MTMTETRQDRPNPRIVDMPSRGANRRENELRNRIGARRAKLRDLAAGPRRAEAIAALERVRDAALPTLTELADSYVYDLAHSGGTVVQPSPELLRAADLAEVDWAVFVLGRIETAPLGPGATFSLRDDPGELRRQSDPIRVELEADEAELADIEAAKQAATTSTAGTSGMS